MLHNQSVTIKLNKTIASIFDDYESTRVKGMDRSFAISDPMQKEKDLALELATEVGGAIVSGELGAVGGQKGVLVAGAYAGAKVLAKNISEYFKGDPNKIMYVHNLEYLKEKSFNDNHNLAEGGFATELEVKQRRKAVLQKLYDYTCSYQRLKGTRFGFKLFGLIFGEHRDDSVIDDPKYLINILIGRKLMLAAKAGSFPEYTNHMTHLSDFLDKIVEKHNLFQTSSDDTKFLSLRSVVNMVRKDLLPKPRGTDAVDTDEMLRQLDNDINSAADETSKLLKEVQERTTYLVCDVKPNEFELKPDVFTQNLELVTKFQRQPYLAILKEVLYKNNKIEDAQLKIFIDDMSAYTGVNPDEDAKEVIKDRFKTLVDNRKRLEDLSILLEQAKGLRVLANVKAYAEVSDKLIYLLNEIKRAQFALIKSQRAFVDILALHYYQKAKSVFKNKFTEHGYKKLLANIKPINDAIIALEEINLNKDEMALKFDVKVADAFQDFKTAVVVPKEQKDYPQDRLETESDSGKEEDKALKDWVLVNLDDSVPGDDYKKFVEKVPAEVKKLSWFQTLFTDAKLQRELKEKDILIKKLEADNNAEKKAKEKALNDKTDAEKAKETAVKGNKDAQKKLLALEATKKINDRIEQYRTTFKRFINDYTQKNKASSIWNFFTHFHGFHGRDVAAFILSEFNDMIDDLNKGQDQLSTDNLHIVMKERYRSLLQRCQDKLDGNFNPHSLKTYLYAYSEYLLANPADSANALQTYHQAAFVVSKRYPEIVELLYHQRFLPESLGTRFQI